MYKNSKREDKQVLLYPHQPSLMSAEVNANPPAQNTTLPVKTRKKPVSECPEGYVNKAKENVLLGNGMACYRMVAREINPELPKEVLFIKVVEYRAPIGLKKCFLTLDEYNNKDKKKFINGQKTFKEGDIVTVIWSSVFEKFLLGEPLNAVCVQRPASELKQMMVKTNGYTTIYTPQLSIPVPPPPKPQLEVEKPPPSIMTVFEKLKDIEPKLPVVVKTEPKDDDIDIDKVIMEAKERAKFIARLGDKEIKREEVDEEVPKESEPIIENNNPAMAVEEPEKKPKGKRRQSRENKDWSNIWIVVSGGLYGNSKLWQRNVELIGSILKNGVSRFMAANIVGSGYSHTLPRIFHKKGGPKRKCYQVAIADGSTLWIDEKLFYTRAECEALTGTKDFDKGLEREPVVVVVDKKKEMGPEPEANVNPDMNANMNMNMNPDMSMIMNPDMDINMVMNPNMGTNPSMNANPNMNMNPDMNMGLGIGLNTEMNSGLRMEDVSGNTFGDLDDYFGFNHHQALSLGHDMNPLMANPFSLTTPPPPPSSSSSSSLFMSLFSQMQEEDQEPFSMLPLPLQHHEEDEEEYEDDEQGIVVVQAIPPLPILSSIQYQHQENHQQDGEVVQVDEEKGVVNGEENREENNGENGGKDGEENIEENGGEKEKRVQVPNYIRPENPNELSADSLANYPEMDPLEFSAMLKYRDDGYDYGFDPDWFNDPNH